MMDLESSTGLDSSVTSVSRRYADSDLLSAPSAVVSEKSAMGRRYRQGRSLGRREPYPRGKRRGWLRIINYYLRGDQRRLGHGSG